jgi:hypothetical protein
MLKFTYNFQDTLVAAHGNFDSERHWFDVHGPVIGSTCMGLSCVCITV